MERCVRSNLTINLDACAVFFLTVRINDSDFEFTLKIARKTGFRRQQ